MRHKNLELNVIFCVIIALFAVFLAAPIGGLFLKSFWGDAGLTGEFYSSVLSKKAFFPALMNSFLVAVTAAVLATAIAFFLACAIHYSKMLSELLPHSPCSCPPLPTALPLSIPLESKD